jgi:hypothetical protein
VTFDPLKSDELVYRPVAELELLLVSSVACTEQEALANGYAYLPKTMIEPFLESGQLHVVEGQQGW